MEVGPDNPPKRLSPLSVKSVAQSGVTDVEDFPDLQSFSVSEENFNIRCVINHHSVMVYDSDDTGTPKIESVDKKITFEM